MESTHNNKKLNEINDLDNQYLIRFNNGIYDLKNKCFINEVKDNNMQLSVGYDYKEFSNNDPIINEINAFFNKFADEDMIKYKLKLISTCLGGTNRDQVIVLCIKNDLTDQLIYLVRCAFGECLDFLPSTILTKKTNQLISIPSDLSKKRILMIEGLQQGDKINTRVLLELCCDNIMQRDLDGNTFTYRPQFKLIIVSKELPYIPSKDLGTWRRLRALNLESKDVEPSSQELYNKINTWKEGFMWLLLNEYYPEYCNNGFNVPDKVIQYTENYRSKILQIENNELD